MVVVHNDLDQYSKETLYCDYFAWLKTELEDISKRSVFINLSDRNDVPELADYNYQNADDRAALQGWRNQTRGVHSEMSKIDSYDINLVKILLLTRNQINETAGGLLGGIGGVAAVKGHCGIASIKSYHTPAHEIGHMLGATHADSEVIYNGWWHDTIMMADDFSNLRGNNYRFSDKNRENIRNYLEQFP